MRWRLILGDLAGVREAVTFGLLVIAITIFSLASPDFLGSLNFSFILTNSVEIGLIALTMTIVMVMGEIHLSVGSIGLAAALLGAMVLHGVPFGIAVVIALATGLVAGLVNAALCIRFALPSVVVTLGTLALYRGIAELAIGANTPSSFPSWFVGWNIDYAFGKITYPQIFWFVCMLIAIVVLHRLRFGRRVSFIGSDPRAAVFAGIRVNRAKVIVFAASGRDVGGCLTDPGVAASVSRQHRRHGLRAGRDHGRAAGGNRFQGRPRHDHRDGARSAAHRCRRDGSSCSESRHRSRPPSSAPC